MLVSKVHSSRALPTRSVPPTGFDYPLDGLRPSIPRRVCFISAALMGFYPSKLFPHAKWPRHFCRAEPTRRFPVVNPADESTVRTDGPRPLGFGLRVSPSPPRAPLSAVTARGSLGLLPFQGNHRRPWSAFIGLTSSRVLVTFECPSVRLGPKRATRTPLNGTTESRSITGSLDRSRSGRRIDGPSRPHKVFAPL